MTLGFGGRGRGRGFVLPIRARDRPIRTNGADQPGCLSAQAGEGVRPLSWPRPGCGLGAGERAGRARAAVGRGPFQAETVKRKSPVLFFFSGKLNMQIGSREK